MQERLDQLWREGQAHESRADYPAAGEAYAAMLALHPHHVPALLRLSRFAQERNAYPQAHQYALRAADAVRLGGSTRLLAYVTLRLLDFAEDAEVASTILGADWRDPDVLRQSPSLAQHLWLAGRYDDAQRLLDAVEPQVGAHPLLRFTRGQLKQYLGDLEGAATHYESALALAPHLPDVHWAIAKLRPSGSPARLQRLRTALASSTDEPGRAQLYYALFHELDAADERDAAWAALAEGAARMRQLHPDTSQATRHARAERLMASDWAPLAAAPKAVQPRPIFILGLPRSGTTLLDRMLGNHGWVSSVGERNDLIAAASEAAGQFYPGLCQLEDPLAFLAGQDLGAIGHAYQQRLRRAAPATAAAIDKHPRNLFELPLILGALPQARIVCVRRDPMDVAFSNLKELFQGGAYAYSYDFDTLAAEVNLARRWMTHWAERAPGSVHVVDYRSLVEDTEPTLSALLAFLDLPPWPGLAHPERNPAPVSTASSVQVRGAVHRGALDAWQRYAAPLAPLAERLADAGR
ncbi:sulfotransferase [Stenotrophomonas sp. HITSZ_GD]|uniref:tetratricopeptide repeat-containing sulfotransferase family protein n=1 Tax=Stenotrophomonas sp. HITSZ_GD TaxID=3037248 RepID=UPI00240E230A|nr:tetratricopeptide repeat-containing sulfotransferase family protein [Stenotrophomonas sp. HITSZ_GD]MDG2524458.1 sulfotransferase [Stenotrophomonas sp. HITSZ_GD]